MNLQRPNARVSGANPHPPGTPQAVTKQRTHRIVVALAAIAIASVPFSQAGAAEVIFSNFDPSGPLTRRPDRQIPIRPPADDSLGFFTRAIGFEHTQGPASLSALNTLVWNFGVKENALLAEFRFHRDEDNHPGEILETWTVNILASETSPNQPFLLTLASSLAPTLLPGAMYWLTFASDRTDSYYIGGSDSIFPGVYHSIYGRAPVFREDGWYTSAPPAFEWIFTGGSQILSGGGSVAHLHVTGNPVPVPPALALLLPVILGWGAAVTRVNVRQKN